MSRSFVENFKNALSDKSCKEIIHNVFIKPILDAHEEERRLFRERISFLENKCENLEQQGRKQSVRIKNVKEEELEDISTDDFVINFAKDNLDYDLDPKDIDISHKLSKEAHDGNCLLYTSPSPRD